jgi:adenylate cyclase
VVKLLFVTLGSIAVATGATMVLGETLPHRTLFGISMVGDSRANLLFIVFVAVFLCSSIPLARSLLSKIDLSAAPAPRVVRRPPAKPVEKLKPKTEPDSLDMKKDAEDETEDGVKSKKKKKKKKKKKRPKDQAAEKEDTSMDFVEEAEDEEDEDEEEEELPVELSLEDEKQKVYMMKFLGDALQTVKAKQQNMDGVSKFGINLYLAGAAEALSHEQNLSAEATAAILSDAVQVLGYKKAQADEFAAKADEYLVSDPKYMRMYEAGRNSMNTCLAGEDDEGARGLVKALENWNKPKSEDGTAGLLTVMFTDIAGSTAMTQELGDAGAQKAVRVHNRIVRQSLTAFGGKEIKHTGDGIMASFSSATNAVESCIEMQRQVEQHNKTDPNLPLHLKIGINAGEPIAEDDDLFGTTVQVAARITDGAKADEIFVSEIVRGICVGKDFKFVNRGGYEMKGLDEPITLFQVVWEEDLTVEEATLRNAAKAEAAQSGPGPETGKAKQVAAPPTAETPPAGTPAAGTPPAAPPAAAPPTAGTPAAAPPAARTPPAAPPAAASTAAETGPPQAAKSAEGEAT